MVQDPNRQSEELDYPSAKKPICTRISLTRAGSRTAKKPQYSQVKDPEPVADTGKKAVILIGVRCVDQIASVKAGADLPSLLCGGPDAALACRGNNMPARVRHAPEIARRVNALHSSAFALAPSPLQDRYAPLSDPACRP